MIPKPPYPPAGSNITKKKAEFISKLERALETIMDKAFTIGIPVVFTTFMVVVIFLFGVCIVDLFLMTTETHFDCERQQIVTVERSVFFNSHYETEYVGQLECEIRQTEYESSLAK